MTGPTKDEVAAMVRDMRARFSSWIGDGSQPDKVCHSVADALEALSAENATLRSERDSYEASAVEAHRVSRAHQSDAILWQYSAAVGDVPLLLVTIWKQRKAAEAELATLRASESAALERVTRLELALRYLLALNDDHGPFGGEMYQDRVNRAWDTAHQALTPTADKEPKI